MTEINHNPLDTKDEIKTYLQWAIEGITNPQILEKLYLILWNETDKLVEIKTKERINEALNTKPQYRLLWADLWGDFKRSIKETTVAIGIRWKRSSIPKKSLPKHTPNYADHNRNYINWLGKKLNFCSSELESMTVEWIDKVSREYLEYAIEHVRSWQQASIPLSEQKNFRSQYFDKIHTLRDIWTVREYLTLYYDLEKEKKEYLRRMKDDAMKKIWSDGVKNCEMAQYEIQRILALAYQYRELEQNHKYIHLEDDTNYIIEKFKELFWERNAQHSTLIPDNPFYHYADTKIMYWERNPNNTYTYSFEPMEGAMTDKFETITIHGYTRDFKGKEITIPILHIAFRSNKDAMSTIDKFNRKQHQSFDQILDHKGVIFVIEKFKDTSGHHPAEMLIKILENKLGDLRSSWVEYPEFKRNSNDNKDTSSIYDVLKGIIKISHSSELLRQETEELAEAVETIRTKVRKSKKKEGVGVLWLGIEKFRRRFENSRYKILLEMQIFDMEGYIRAELDEASPAHHSWYKQFQQVTSLPLYYPKEIYGEENLTKVMYPIIHKKIKNDMETKKTPIET